MPGFVTNAVAVATWKTQVESKFACAATQPAKRGGVAEFFIEADVVRRTDVERAAGVVLAEAGRGDELEDRCEALAGGEFRAAGSRGMRLFVAQVPT